ncbi:MAG TPA: hypothetical protein VGG64_20910 [Pirellulales bacterium]|jgi:hypothetical protein
MRAFFMCVAVVLLFAVPVVACPPVALSQGVATAQAVAMPQFVAQPQQFVALPTAQSVVGLGSPVASATTSVPLAVTQPVVFAASPFASVQATSVASACNRAGARCGVMSGGRGRLLPRQRVVSKAIVR